MTAPSESQRRNRPARRLWSLPLSRRAHGMTEEIEGIEPILQRAYWLLLALALTYAAALHASLPPGARLILWAGGMAYAAALLALQYAPPRALPRVWPALLRVWATIAYVSAVLWAMRIDTGALVTLYHLAVIASAATLPRRLTLLNLAIIGACLFGLSQVAAGDATQGRLPALSLFAQLAPMLLVAYVTAHVAGDIRRALDRLRYVSDTDELTRLYNLRAFMRIAERFHRQARRYQRRYSLVMIDSDNLKSINDTHGHQCGNDLLKLTTAAIRRELRETDVAARYGGDEFIVLLPETAAAGARELAERIRRSVGSKHLEVRGLRVTTTISLGVASFPEHGVDLSSIVNKADQAMYLAKRTGRNRVVSIDAD